MTTRETNPTEPTAAGDEGIEVEGHRHVPRSATEQPDTGEDGEPEVEGHRRRRSAVPSDQTGPADPAGGDAAAASEESDGQGNEVEGHFIGTNPYIMERTAEARRGQFQAEADRARQANEARKPRR